MPMRFMMMMLFAVFVVMPLSSLVMDSGFTMRVVPMSIAVVTLVSVTMGS